MPRTLAVGRLVGVATLAAAAAALMFRILRTWQKYVAEMNGFAQYQENIARFTSHWTFFFPAAVGAALVVLGGTFILRDRHSLIRHRVIVDVAYLLLAFAFLWLLHERLWYVYEPGHSGPAL